MEDIKWTHLQEVLDRYGQYFIEAVKRKMLQNGSNATGNLVNSFAYRTFIEDGHYGVEVEMEDYWKYVDEGRRPGKMPPVEKIKQWVLVKPVKPYPYTYTPSVKSLAFLIQRSIREKKGYAPPRAILEDWINKKGIRPRPVKVLPSVDTLAFLIARKIGRVGTKGTNFFSEAEEETYRYFERSIDNAIQEDYTYWLEEVVADTLSAMNIQ